MSAAQEDAENEVNGVCREVLNGWAHTKERKGATWCNDHAEQHRRWGELKKTRIRRGQPIPDWIPLPVKPELKHTEFKIPSPAWLDEAHQRLLRDLDRIDRAVTNLQKAIAHAKPVPRWLSDTIKTLEAASGRMRAELDDLR